MKPEDGGPAFPFVEHGMTLRDYFAGQAIILSGASAWESGEFRRAENGAAKINVEMAAETAYRIADAMLAQRAKATLGGFIHLEKRSS